MCVIWTVCFVQLVTDVILTCLLGWAELCSNIFKWYVIQVILGSFQHMILTIRIQFGKTSENNKGKINFAWFLINLYIPSILKTVWSIMSLQFIPIPVPKVISEVAELTSGHILAIIVNWVSPFFNWSPKYHASIFTNGNYPDYSW